MAINFSTITINASKQKVWDIIAKPEFVKQSNITAEKIDYEFW